MRGVEVVRRGPERVRVGRWRGDPSVAHLVPVADAPPVTSAMVRHCCAVLAARGYASVVTGALARREQRGFLDDGFTVREELHLLAHDLRSLPRPAPPPGTRLRRGHRWDRARTLEVDGLAFPPFWRLDRLGFEEALAATPRSRHRVAVRAGRLVGYAVAGRAGDRGYLQRLAVDPAEAGRGLGAALVLDALAWQRGHGVTRSVVNTQVGNDRALALYRRLGFRLEPSGLAVLSRPLADRQPARG